MGYTSLVMIQGVHFTFINMNTMCGNDFSIE